MKTQVYVRITPEQVHSLLSKHYPFQVKRLTKVRAVYRVETDRGVYAFKNARKLQDYPFQLAVIQHLQKEGFPRIAKLVPTLDQKWNIFYQGETYCLETWLTQTQEVDPERMDWLAPAGKALACFHRTLTSFPPRLIPPKRFNSPSWRKELNHLRSYLEKQQQNKQRTELDQLMRKRYHQSKYYQRLAGNGPLTYTLCHGSLHHKNIMIDQQNRVWLIDFERMVYGQRVQDLAQLMQYHFSVHHWPQKHVSRLVEAYHTEYPLSPQEMAALSSRLLLPPRLIHYYYQYSKLKRRDLQFITKLTQLIKEEKTKEKLFQRGCGIFATESAFER